MNYNACIICYTYHLGEVYKNNILRTICSKCLFFNVDNRMKLVNI